jgi:hypothetical protein
VEKCAKFCLGLRASAAHRGELRAQS